MNEYDTSKMVDVLRESHGMELTDHPEEASVLLLNTCSVREKAQEKVFSLLGRWRHWKRSNPSLVIGVGGCRGSLPPVKTDINILIKLVNMRSASSSVSATYTLIPAIV